MRPGDIFHALLFSIRNLSFSYYTFRGKVDPILFCQIAHNYGCYSADSEFVWNGTQPFHDLALKFDLDDRDFGSQTQLFDGQDCWSKWHGKQEVEGRGDGVGLGARWMGSSEVGPGGCHDERCGKPALSCADNVS